MLFLKATESSNLAPKALKADDDKVVEVDNRANKMVVNLSKNLTHVPNIKAIGKSNFLTSNTKKTFNYL